MGAELTCDVCGRRLVHEFDYYDIQDVINSGERLMCNRCKVNLEYLQEVFEEARGNITDAAIKILAGDEGIHCDGTD
jgi:hypothetical protein